MQEVVRQGYFLNAVNGATTTTSVPTLSTDGVAVPNNRRGKHVIVRVRTTTSSTATGTLRIFGYVPAVVDANGDLVAGGGGWVDTEEIIEILSTSSASFARYFEALTIFTRLAIVVTAIAGTATTISASFGFTDEE